MCHMWVVKFTTFVQELHLLQHHHCPHQHALCSEMLSEIQTDKRGGTPVGVVQPHEAHHIAAQLQHRPLPIDEPAQ